MDFSEATMTLCTFDFEEFYDNLFNAIPRDYAVLHELYMKRPLTGNEQHRARMLVMERRYKAEFIIYPATCVHMMKLMSVLVKK